jgi:hypothetical protein
MADFVLAAASMAFHVRPAMFSVWYCFVPLRDEMMK